MPWNIPVFPVVIRCWSNSRRKIYPGAIKKYGSKWQRTCQAAAYPVVNAV